jgi:site-specific DNA-methyltransferase (adenine-specific)
LQNLINNICCGDCKDIIKELDNDIINLVITSPPYANQRKKQYGGISEIDYPAWMKNIMDVLWDKMKNNGSIFIVIRPHIKNGIISDYVLKTRLLLRESGWKECEELIWVKQNGPPLGSIKRPRRSWESILWFSKSGDPYCNPKISNNITKGTGFGGSKFGEGGDSPIHAGQNIKHRNGIPRVPDYITTVMADVDKNIKHPAMYPPQIPEYLIKMCSKENDIILDPFVGSGTSVTVAKKLNRRFIGMDISEAYCEIARKRINET